MPVPWGAWAVPAPSGEQPFLIPGFLIRPNCCPLLVSWLEIPAQILTLQVEHWYWDGSDLPHQLTCSRRSCELRIREHPAPAAGFGRQDTSPLALALQCHTALSPSFSPLSPLSTGELNIHVAFLSCFCGSEGGPGAELAWSQGRIKAAVE